MNRFSIRRPSHWRDIDRNLRLLDRRFDDWKIGWAAVSVTVQMYNALHLHELFAYLRTAGFARIVPIPHLSRSFIPSTYLSRACPAEQRRWCGSEFIRK